jgi:PadR family transcriptional regulator PadR
MEDGGATSGWRATQHARFDLTPPRHFLLPAVLLLLSEEPGYGYHLARRLKELRFGRVDRPSVYRALAQLERDGLVASSPDPAKAGQERRVYQVTDDGQRALRGWMGVIKEERDRLDSVLRRYMATGTVDALLAEVEGGWRSVTGPAWSPVSSSSHVEGRHRRSLASPPVTSVAGEATSASATATGATPDGGRDDAPSRFRVLPDRSVALIEARSTVGPITFGVIGVAGTVETDVRDGSICLDRPPVAHLEIRVDGLRSGNKLYDAELLRRIDARRFPSVLLDLRDCVPAGAANRFRLAGDITFHGVSRPLEGTVSVTTTTGGRLVVHGEHVLDIRDFGMASPTVLMLRIYPDVKVQLQVEAELEG